MPERPVSGSRRAAIGLLTLACAAWGLSFVFLKDVDGALSGAGLTYGAAAGWVVAVRFLLSFLVLIPWPAVRRGLRGPAFRDGFLLAVPSVLGYGLQAAGMRGLESGTNAFLTSLYTPFTPLLAWLLFRRTPAARVLAAVPVALAGVAVLSSDDGSGGLAWLSRFGIHHALVVAGAVCWALQILLIDRYGRRHPSGPLAAALLLWTGLLALGSLVLLRGGASPGDLAGALLRADLQVPIWGLVLLSTVFTLVVLVRYQPRLDPSRAALLYLLEPAFAAVFAVLLHGEPFGGWKLAGCLLLLGANVLVEVRRPRWRAQGPDGGTVKR